MEAQADRDAWLKKLTYTKVCEWLAALGVPLPPPACVACAVLREGSTLLTAVISRGTGVNEDAIQKVREDRVPGSQIMLMDGGSHAPSCPHKRALPYGDLLGLTRTSFCPSPYRALWRPKARRPWSASDKSVMRHQQ